MFYAPVNPAQGCNTVDWSKYHPLPAFTFLHMLASVLQEPSHILLFACCGSLLQLIEMACSDGLTIDCVRLRSFWWRWWWWFSRRAFITWGSHSWKFWIWQWLSRRECDWASACSKLKTSRRSILSAAGPRTIPSAASPRTGSSTIMPAAGPRTRPSATSPRTRRSEARPRTSRKTRSEEIRMSKENGEI